MTALAALKPLAHWAPLVARFHRGEAGGRELLESAGNDLSQVLQAAVQLGAGAETAVAGEAASLADSLRDTVGHVESAARAVKDGKLEQVLAEARRKLGRTSTSCAACTRARTPHRPNGARHARRSTPS